MRKRGMKMKKLTAFLAALILCLSGCQNTEKPENEVADVPKTEEKSGYMCNLLWERSDTGTDSVILKEDFDSDGQKEEVLIRVANGALEIKSDSYAYNSGNLEAYVLSKVYFLDLDTEDGLAELAVLTVEESDDPCVRVFRAGSDSIGPLGFKCGEGGVNTGFYSGYDQNIYVNEKNVLTLSKRGSFGMWSVEDSFSLKDGVLYEIPEEERKVVYPSYGEIAELLTKEELIDNLYILNDEEYGLLRDKGMAVAHADFDPASGETLMELRSGEAFSVIAEKDDGKVKIRKENGEEGYIDLSDWSNNRMNVSMIMFFLAD